MATTAATAAEVRAAAPGWGPSAAPLSFTSLIASHSVRFLSSLYPTLLNRFPRLKFIPPLLFTAPLPLCGSASGIRLCSVGRDMRREEVMKADVGNG